MNIRKPVWVGLFATLLCGCIDWSVEQPQVGKVDCTLYDNAAQRYPGICGADAGHAPDAHLPADGGSDAGEGDMPRSG